MRHDNKLTGYIPSCFPHTCYVLYKQLNCKEPCAVISGKIKSRIYLQAAQDCLSDLNVFAFILDKNGRIVDFAQGMRYFIPGFEKDSFIGDFLLDGFEADFAQWIFACLQKGCHDDFKSFFRTSILGHKAEVICRGFWGEYCSVAVRSFQDSSACLWEDPREKLQFRALLHIIGVDVNEEFINVFKFMREIWQCPEIGVKLSVLDTIYTSDSFQPTPWSISQGVHVIEREVGKIEVFYPDPVKDDDSLVREKKILKAAGDHLGKVIACGINKKQTANLISELRSHNTKLKTVFDSVEDSVFIVDSSMRVIACNKHFKTLWNCGVGDHCFEKILGSPKRCCDCVVWDVFETSKVRKKEFNTVLKGEQISVNLIASPLRFKTDKVEQVIVFLKDLTPFKKAQEQVKDASAALQIQKDILMRKNYALREMLVLLEEEKKSIAEKIDENITVSILPVVEKLKSEIGRKDKIRTMIELLEGNLSNLTSSFGVSIGQKKFRLTAREIEICNMIKNGLCSKEIADQLGITSRTVEIHRGNIRKKLGISGSSQSLASFLLEL